MPEKKKERRPGGSIHATPVSAKHGRVTPKGTTPTAKGSAAKGSAAKGPGGKGAGGVGMPSSGRYTPPIPQQYKVSARWVPIVMGILLIGGMLTIMLNYLSLLPGGDASNSYLLGGLGLITAGFIVATRWR